MNQHTPPPWVLADRRPHLSEDYIFGRGVGGSEIVICEQPFPEAGDEAKRAWQTNRHLLKAAPNLFAACEALIAAMKKSEDGGSTDHLDCHDDGGKFWYDAIRDGKSAIAKARGEVQG